MAELFKKNKRVVDHYDYDYLQLIASKISSVYPDFNHKSFISTAKKDLDNYEFMQRQIHIANALKLNMSGDYLTDLAVFTRILGPELESDLGMFKHGWWLWPIGKYLELNSHKQPKKNLNKTFKFIEELTKRFTGEFAIRDLLVHHPDESLKKILKFSSSDNVHVRRLASESIRPNLPWAKRNNIFLDYYDSCCDILTNLAQDQSRFVQKSVANNLNDWVKYDPYLSLTLLEKWDCNKEFKDKEVISWITKHGLRNFNKNL